MTLARSTGTSASHTGPNASRAVRMLASLTATRLAASISPGIAASLASIPATRA